MMGNNSYLAILKWKCVMLCYWHAQFATQHGLRIMLLATKHLQHQVAFLGTVRDIFILSKDSSNKEYTKCGLNTFQKWYHIQPFLSTVGDQMRLVLRTFSDSTNQNDQLWLTFCCQWSTWSFSNQGDHGLGSIHLSVHPSVHPSVHLWICLSALSWLNRLTLFFGMGVDLDLG